MMREDIDKSNLEQDLEDLKADVDKLSADLAHLLRKSTVGRIENKITRRPFTSLLWAFGIGAVSCGLLKWFCHRTHCSED